MRLPSKPAAFSLIALAVVLPATCPDLQPSAHAEPAKKVAVPTELPGLLNFHVVHPYLFRGGEPSSTALKELKERGVAAIIDLRAASKLTEEEGRQAQALGMKYTNLPMSSKAPTKEQIDTFLSQARQARDGKTGPLYVHCQHGSDRTGCLIGIWRVSEDGWPFDKAYTEMRKYFFGPKYIELSGTVRKYAEQYAKKTETAGSSKGRDKEGPKE